MEGYIGEIRMFAGNFAPKNWAFCSGQIVAIQQNTALFSILGTTYGGNGQSTFALPDYRGRVGIGVGAGPGLTPVDLGEVKGTEGVTLTINNLPTHVHQQMGSGAAPTQNTASGAALATNGRSTTPPMPNIYTNGGAPVPMGTQTGPSGGNQPFSIMQPVLGINYIICMYGIFPSRN